MTNATIYYTYAWPRAKDSKLLKPEHHTTLVKEMEVKPIVSLEKLQAQKQRLNLVNQCDGLGKYEQI